MRQKKFGNVWYIRGECLHSISPTNSSILIMSNGIVIIKMMLIIMARYGFWNNGMAMQRMIENGQADIAYTLFRNMKRQGTCGRCCRQFIRECGMHGHVPGRHGCVEVELSCRRGVIASISAWNQYFLGIRPDMLNHSITIDPQLPSELKVVDSRVNIGDGTLRMIIAKNDASGTYRYEWTGTPVTLKLISILIRHWMFRFQQITR